VGRDWKTGRLVDWELGQREAGGSKHTSSVRQAHGVEIRLHGVEIRLHGVEIQSHGVQSRAKAGGAAPARYRFCIR